MSSTGEGSLGSWSAPEQETAPWASIAAEGDRPEPATPAARSKRPTAYGLPPLTSEADEPLAQPAPAPRASELPATPAGPSLIERVNALTGDRPELLVGAAFAGGLLLATILRRLAR